MIAASALIAPLSLAIDRPWTASAPTATQLMCVLGLGVLSTAAAYLLFFRILARAGATNVMLVTLLVPPTAILIGWLFLGEQLEARNFLGLGFIALGLGLIDGRPLRWTRAKMFARPTPGPAAADSPCARLD